MPNFSDTNIWGIHGGHTGDANSLFLKKSCVAIGWENLTDLSAISPEREAFKRAVAKAYPNFKPNAIPNNAGQLYRFVHELKKGDLIVYPSKQDRMIHIGQIESDYFYDPKTEPGYPHVRKVKWLRELPRTHFSQGALYEIGSAMSFFQVKNYADEYRTALSGRAATITPVSEDESVAVVTADIEETTHDFVLKRLAQELKGHPFAHFVAHLLNTMGYRTRVSPEGADGGVDILAHRDELGFEPPIIKVQVKSTEGSIGDPIVSALYGKVSHGEYGLLVTLGTYTPAAKKFAESKVNLRLINGSELVQLIFQHYDQFESRYRGLLPLKRVYVPEVIEAEEESSSRSIASWINQPIQNHLRILMP
jgi:restriction system protein